MSHASSHPRPSQSMSSRMSSAMTSDGWVSFNCMKTLSGNASQALPSDLKRRTMSCSEQETKKYSCLQAEFLAVEYVVVRIEDLGQVFGEDFVRHRVDILAAVEVVEIEILGCVGRPQAQRVHRAAAVSRRREGRTACRRRSWYRPIAIPCRWVRDDVRRGLRTAPGNENSGWAISHG